MDVVVNDAFLIITRVISILMSLVLFGIGVEGVRLGVLNVKYRQASEPAYITLDLWLLSSWLVFVSFFMFLGHLRRPQTILRYFAFLNTYFGRGLLDMLVGSTMISLGVEHLVVFICGIITCTLGLFSVVLSCPCFSMVENEDNINSISDYNRRMEGQRGMQRGGHHSNHSGAGMGGGGGNAGDDMSTHGDQSYRSSHVDNMGGGGMNGGGGGDGYGSTGGYQNTGWGEPYDYDEYEYDGVVGGKGAWAKSGGGSNTRSMYNNAMNNNINNTGTSAATSGMNTHNNSTMMTNPSMSGGSMPGHMHHINNAGGGGLTNRGSGSSNGWGEGMNSANTNANTNGGVMPGEYEYDEYHYSSPALGPTNANGSTGSGYNSARTRSPEHIRGPGATGLDRHSLAGGLTNPFQHVAYQ